MKIFHDDIRLPPDDTWTWARTNDQAKDFLKQGGVEEISLDHDLGMDHMNAHAPGAALLKGVAEETGLDLVKWMVANDCVPPMVVIHSWNPGGAQNMRNYFYDNRTKLTKHSVVAVIPFVL